MISCPAHWSLLSEALQAEVVAAWDQLVAERRVGNPRRASRDRLARAKREAAAELEHVRDSLEQQVGHTVGASGQVWLRELRRLEAMSEEAPDAAEA